MSRAGIGAGVFEQAGLERNVESWKTGARTVSNRLGERLKDNPTANLRSLVENEPLTFDPIAIRHLQCCQPTQLSKKSKHREQQQIFDQNVTRVRN